MKFNTSLFTTYAAIHSCIVSAYEQDNETIPNLPFRAKAAKFLHSRYHAYEQDNETIPNLLFRAKAAKADLLVNATATLNSSKSSRIHIDPDPITESSSATNHGKCGWIAIIVGMMSTMHEIE